MKLFNVWGRNQSRKVAIRAFDEDEALNLFCEMHGWADYAEYSSAKGPGMLSIETA